MLLVLPTQVQLMAQAGEPAGFNVQLALIAIAKARIRLLGCRQQLHEQCILRRQGAALFKLGVLGKILQGGLHQALTTRNVLDDETKQM
ncbi:hypothetical protein D3C78_1638470 [compost metagenome]